MEQFSRFNPNTPSSSEPTLRALPLLRRDKGELAHWDIPAQFLERLSAYCYQGELKNNIGTTPNLSPADPKAWDIFAETFYGDIIDLSEKITRKFCGYDSFLTNREDVFINTYDIAHSSIEKFEKSLLKKRFLNDLKGEYQNLFVSTEPRGYMALAIRRTVLDILRRPHSENHSEEILSSLPVSANVADTIGSTELESDVLSLIATSLHHSQKDIWELHYQGYSNGEIAQIRGSSVEAIKATLSRAKKNIRCIVDRETIEF